jgi:hypothetical protein
MGSGTRSVDQRKYVVGLHSVVPSSASPKWVSMKGYNHITLIVMYKNATTVTGSAIGLQQATAVAGTAAKTLAFTKMWTTLDDAASAVLTETSVVGNTFTTDATNSKNGIYIIEVEAGTLDINNGFDCIRATVGDAVSTTVDVLYELCSGNRYGGGFDSFMNPLAD